MEWISRLTGKPGQDGTDTIGVIASIACISSIGIGIGLSYPLLSLILESRGHSATLIGAHSAVAGVASMAAIWLINPLATRFGVINSILICAVSAALSFFCFYLTDSIAAWFILRVIFHGALTPIFVLSEFWINSASSSRRRGLILGIYATVLSAGFGIGPAILTLTGIQTILPFAIGSAIILLACTPVLAARRSEPSLDDMKKSSGGFMKFIWAVPLATGAVAVFGAVEQSLMPLLPVYGGRLGYNEQMASGFLVFIALGNMMLQIPLGILSDRVKDRRHILYLCAAIGLAGTLLLPVVLDPGFSRLWLFSVLFFWGGVISGLYTIGLAHLGSQLEGADLAEANAAFVFAYTVGMILGPQLSGMAMEYFPPHGLSWMLAFFFSVYGALCIWRFMGRS